MKNILQVVKKTEHQYNFLVQIDFLMGLYSAYLLGARDWYLFFPVLGACLILGWFVVKFWAKTVKDITIKALQR